MDGPNRPGHLRCAVFFQSIQNGRLDALGKGRGVWMQSHVPMNREVRAFQVVLGLIICQGLAMVPFFVWQNYPARLLEMLP
jgi:hypothetical protein